MTRQQRSGSIHLERLASEFQPRGQSPGPVGPVNEVVREGSDRTALATALAGVVVQAVEARLADLSTLQFEVVLVPEG